MKMLSLLINEQGAQFIEVENTNEGINEALGWDDAWNTPTIRVRGHEYILICSDLGKIKHEKVSALSYNNLIEPKEALQEPFMVGTILISKFDGTDDLEALNENDVEILKSRLYTHKKTYLKDYYKTILVID